MVRNWDIWGFSSIRDCPRNSSFRPETKTVIQKVKGTTTFVVVRNRPCKIVQIRTWTANERLLIAIDIFKGKMFKAIFPLYGNCVVPVVTLTQYQLVDISEEDSHVVVLDDKGHKKCDLDLPTDQDMLSRIKFGLAKGKDVFVSVASAMGEEKIIASRIKDTK